MPHLSSYLAVIVSFLSTLCEGFLNLKLINLDVWFCLFYHFPLSSLLITSSTLCRSVLYVKHVMIFSITFCLGCLLDLLTVSYIFPKLEITFSFCNTNFFIYFIYYVFLIYCLYTFPFPSYLLLVKKTTRKHPRIHKTPLTHLTWIQSFVCKEWAQHADLTAINDLCYCDYCEWLI